MCNPEAFDRIPSKNRLGLTARNPWAALAEMQRNSRLSKSAPQEPAENTPPPIPFVTRLTPAEVAARDAAAKTNVASPQATPMKIADSFIGAADPVINKPQSGYKVVG